MIEPRAFSSEVDTGSRKENASKQETEPRSDSIGTEKALPMPAVGQGPNASMPAFGLCDRLPDFAAAVGALIDEVDLRHAPMGFDVSDEHGQQSQAAWADNRGFLNLMVMHISWHVGSPCIAKARSISARELTYRVRSGPFINSRERMKNSSTLLACVTVL
jgi:hypothetical protein